MTSIRSVKVLRGTLHKQSNDQTEKTQDGTEDLDNKDLDETAATLDSDLKVWQMMYLQRRISSICQRCATSVDTNGDTADQIAHADCETCPE